jgi:UDP-N-acetylmuramoylalanine--D-glutamate ligase
MDGKRAAWSGQRVLILGAARQGTALARYLVTHGAQVTLNDRQEKGNLTVAIRSLQDLGESVRWECGAHPLGLLDGTDLVCISGGVPLTNPIVAEAQRRNIPLSNDSQLFLEAAPCRVIGITGSAGKTTTTTLVGRMAKFASQTEGGRRMTDQSSSSISRHSSVYVGGNIGSPLIAQVDEMSPDDIAVIELSSFQLEIMTRSPQVAAVLNVTPNHLDRHGTMQVYLQAKKRILDFQGDQDVAVLGRDDPGAWGLASQVKGEIWTFGLQKLTDAPGTYVKGDRLNAWDGGTDTWLMDRTSILLRGEHNLLNVLAACAIGSAAGLSASAMRQGVEGFRGVPHRLELVRTWGGAEWYNDSIATAPERSMAAIRSFQEPIVLLAGGRDKDLPWEDFAALVRQRVAHLILFGEATARIAAAIGENYRYIRCRDLLEAVHHAAQVVRPGDVVLLSPGGTSFDEFKDYEERGECFRQLVMSL